MNKTDARKVKEALGYKYGLMVQMYIMNASDEQAAEIIKSINEKIRTLGPAKIELTEEEKLKNEFRAKQAEVYAIVQRLKEVKPIYLTYKKDRN